MAQGLQIWNADGDLILDTGERLSRFYNYIDLPAISVVASPTAKTGTIAESGLASGQPYYNIGYLQGPYQITSYPTVVISGSILTWTYSAADLLALYKQIGSGKIIQHRLFYGTY